MIKYLFAVTVLLLLIECGVDYSKKSEPINSKASKLNSVIKTDIIFDTTLVKNWLSRVIMGYFSGEDLKAAYNNMRSALTDDYYQYKLDAINLEYNDEMSEDEFHQKWKTKFDTKYVGNGGFFMSSQDSGTMEILSCTLLKSLGDTAQVFHVVIRDLHWKTNSVGDITVVSKDNKLYIADIKEYE